MAAGGDQSRMMPRIRDAGGALFGDGAARGELRADEPGRVPSRGEDHWSSGSVTDAMNALSVQDMRHILSMRLRSRFF